MPFKSIVTGSLLILALSAASQPTEEAAASVTSDAAPEVGPEDAPQEPHLHPQEPLEPAAEAVSQPPFEPAETGESPAEPEIPRRGEAPTREFMVGVWSEDLSKCGSALDFKADGSLIGPFPRWELEDGVLTLVGNRQKIQLKVIDKDTLQSRRSETDSPRTLKRCPPAE